MLNLLRKETRLVMHPTTVLFLALSAMVLIPNYPYYVTFFYTGLTIFFTCLNGRENNDIAYTLLLPVRKADAVRARFVFVVLLQLAQMLLAAAFIVLRSALDMPPNLAGMDANLALLGLSFLMLGLFNWVFFSLYYGDTAKVGKAFAWSSVAVFGYMLVMEALTHAVPFFRDCLDTPDPQFLGYKAALFAVGLLFWLSLTAFACRRSVRRFEALDQ